MLPRAKRTSLSCQSENYHQIRFITLDSIFKQKKGCLMSLMFTFEGLYQAAMIENKLWKKISRVSLSLKKDFFSLSRIQHFLYMSFTLSIINIL